MLPSTSFNTVEPVAGILPKAGLSGTEAVRSHLEMEADLGRVERMVNEFFVESDDYRIAPPPCSIPEGFLMSVVIPVYNEEATISRVVGRILEIPVNKEVIIVDDGSTDNTRDVLEYIMDHPDVRIILQHQNAGKGAALRTGFEAARGDVVVIQDADLEYDPRDIPGLLVPILNGDSDVVYGSRFLGEQEHDKSWVHRLGNGILTRASNWTTGWKLTDMETCYKVFRRDLLQSIPIEQNRFGFEPEITAKLARRKARISEVPVSYNARSYSEGKKIGIRDLFNAFYCIIRYGWFSR